MLNKNTDIGSVAGFKLRYILQGHKETINRIAWSPDGQLLAAPSSDRTIWLWDAEKGKLLRKLAGHHFLDYATAWSPTGRILASGSVVSVIFWDRGTGEQLWRLTGKQSVTTSACSLAWSPDGQTLAIGTGFIDGDIQLWDITNKKQIRTLKGHNDLVFSIAWSPDGQLFASGSNDATVRLWNMKSKHPILTLTGHSQAVLCVAWSPDGQILASASSDRTIQLWSPDTGRQVATLEGHTGSVTCISFSADGHLLASKSHDGTFQLWRTDTWESILTVTELSSGQWSTSLAFHPSLPILATLGKQDKVIRIWDVNSSMILDAATTTPSIHYTNAKVVLVGDSGVGKTGLSLVLNGRPFIPTDSTHGRFIWTFESEMVELDGGRKETRETLLWDLAGQPGYRLIHQLHLSEVAVALVVFDARSETDPFSGVHHWIRALRQVQSLYGGSTSQMRKFLIAARIDRGGKSISRNRIDLLVLEQNLDGYFETSAKEGWGIGELKEAIRAAINWEKLPHVSSTELFQRIKDFLVTEKELGRLLSTADDLYRAFLRTEEVPDQIKVLSTQFETCIGLVESRGLIRRLSFGNLVLLQPELLDAYASALVNSVRDDPDGLGSILEEGVYFGEFRIPKEERLNNKDQEKLLLIAMVEDLLRHEIVLREQSENGPYLIFPSQSTREYPDLPDPQRKTVIFDFEGPVLNIYATLAVRLSHSGLFEKSELWRNAVLYKAKAGGFCGMYLQNVGEGRGKLMLFFEEGASEETCFHFEEYIQAHLQRRALPESIKRRRIFICPKCEETFTDSQVMHRRELGFDWIRCSVCDTQVPVLDRKEQLIAIHRSLVSDMDRAANTRREREVGISILQGRREIGDFDVFLCYNSEDRSEVMKIGERLKEKEILPWLDEWELQPGLPWQRLLEQQIEGIKSAAVFIGQKGIGPWQQLELETFLREFVRRECPVIPVLLAGAPKKPKLPLFLANMTWVDFRNQDFNPMERLIWGITGKHRAHR